MPAAAQAACSLRASAVAKLVAVAKAKLYRRARRPGPERCDVNALWAKNAKNPFRHRGVDSKPAPGISRWVGSPASVRRHMRRRARWAAVNAHTHAQVHGPGALPMRVRTRTCVCFLVVGLLGSMLGYLVAILGHPGRRIRMRTFNSGSMWSSHTHAHMRPVVHAGPSWGRVGPSGGHVVLCRDLLVSICGSSSGHLGAI